MTAVLTTTTISSPVGGLTLASITDGHGPRVAMVEFGHRAPEALDTLAAGCRARLVPSPWPVLCPALALLIEELGRYFTGDLRAFEAPLALVGTAFQCRVWEALCEVPYGQVVSYGALAGRLGLGSGASRAVGAANGANRLAIVVPCHRVLAADGTLHGYGGGLERKRWLLDHERTVVGGLFARTG